MNSARIAILGATSQIAKDLIHSYAANGQQNLHLFARRPEAVQAWLQDTVPASLYPVSEFSAFPLHEFDVIINFVGVGNPAQAAAMGGSIFDLTLQYDNLALEYLQKHPDCRYLFLSSGAAYGSDFSTPAQEDTLASVNLNNLKPQDWYGAAKLHAECRHRALPGFSIADVRVFNYFSRTQDLSARFLMTDIVRNIIDGTVLETSAAYMVRDYLHPHDFYLLVESLVSAQPANTAVDCYSKAPVDKPQLLAEMQRHFGLRYHAAASTGIVNATGAKPHYYSTNTKASLFGYAPTRTSIEGVLEETSAILQGCSHQ